MTTTEAKTKRRIAEVEIENILHALAKGTGGRIIGVDVDVYTSLDEDGKPETTHCCAKIALAI